VLIIARRKAHRPDEADHEMVAMSGDPWRPPGWRRSPAPSP
jgi:hypothetical protein